MRIPRPIPLRTAGTQEGTVTLEHARGTQPRHWRFVDTGQDVQAQRGWGWYMEARHPVGTQRVVIGRDTPPPVRGRAGQFVRQHDANREERGR